MDLRIISGCSRGASINNRNLNSNLIFHFYISLSNACDFRISGCKYSRIGCPWRGPMHESKQHEQECPHPRRSGAEVMDALQVIDQQVADERKLYENIFELLGYEKITFNGNNKKLPSFSLFDYYYDFYFSFLDLQLKPYRTEEFVHRLYYETSRFSAFNNQWVVKARINNSQKDPTQSSERDITYQVCLNLKKLQSKNAIIFL